MKTVYKILISLTIGAISTPVFFSLYGIIANFDVEHHFLRWVFSLPRAYQLTAGLLHSFAVEMIAAIPVIFIAGIIIGFLVKNKPVFFGLITVAGFFICETIYFSIMVEKFGFYHYGSTIWYTLGSIISWILLFILMTKLGTTIRIKGLKSDIKT
ncbi:MAG: hypothetical protein ABSF79_12035 [Smithellaceae bacterium]